MRKAARKQKKLEKRNQVSPSSNSELVYCTAMDIPQISEITVVFDYKADSSWDLDQKKLFLVAKDCGNFAKGIAHNNTVEKISCSFRLEILDYLADALKINTSVQTLHITRSYAAVNDNNISKFIGIIAHIIQFSNLTSLLLSFDHQDIQLANFDAIISALKNNDKLTSFVIPSFEYSTDEYEGFIDAIKNHPNIRHLTVYPLLFKDRYLEPIGDIIRNNKLTTLTMDRSRCWNRQPWTSIVNALKENTSLTDVSLALRNYQYDSCLLVHDDIKLLADVLRNNQTLTKLDISGNNLKMDLVPVLDALQHNNTLTKLDFWGNRLDGTIQPSISTLLISNEALTELDLSHTRILPDLIGPALKNNKSVTSLNLSFNNVGSLGCIYLAEGLKFNKTLTRLNLKESKVDDSGCRYLSGAIKTNQCLLHLDISGQDIKVEGYKALIDGLSDNDSLTDLVLSRDRNVPYHMHEKILDLQNKNKKYRQDTIISTITILIQIARSGAFDIFPLEIWLRIFKHLVCGGIPGFNNVAEKILMHSDVWDLPSLCKMRIVRINGKSHLVANK